MFEKLLSIVRSAFELLKVGGFKEFGYQLRRQIYSRHIQIGLTKELEETVRAPVASNTGYYIRLASPQDMEESFQKASTESKESARLLLSRKWLYHRGLRNWYIARTVATDEPCFIQGVIQPEENEFIEARLKNWFPRLQEDEILLEGAYTFEKYRGNRLHPVVLADILDIYCKRGFHRVITYIEKNNIASLKGAARLGFIPFQETPVLKILFFTKRESKRIAPRFAFESAGVPEQTPRVS